MMHTPQIIRLIEDRIFELDEQMKPLWSQLMFATEKGNISLANMCTTQFNELASAKQELGRLKTSIEKVYDMTVNESWKESLKGSPPNPLSKIVKSF